ncbi:hypothetical protein Agub_g1082, partial [Astrephomene gubernaculifera]
PNTRTTGPTPGPAAAAAAAAAHTGGGGAGGVRRSNSVMSAAASGPQAPGAGAAAGAGAAGLQPADAAPPAAPSGVASPTTSQQSMSLPTPAARAALAGQTAASAAGGDGGGGGGGGAVEVDNLASEAAGGGGGGTEVSSISGGDGGGGPLRPPAAQTSYRADSTLSLAVHRGAAAMDWEGDGQNEVRGPEHLLPAPSGTSAQHAARAPAHSHRPQPRPLPGRTPASGPTAHHGNNNANNATSGGSGGPSSAASSPRHPAEHPSLVTLPEPSLYSKLLLPPLPLPPQLQPAAAAGNQHAPKLEPLPPVATVTVAAATAAEAPEVSAVPASDDSAAAAAAVLLPASLAGEPLNVRATWLAGRPVYGDAVATSCRQSPTPQLRKNHHLMKWRSYGAADFWRTAAASCPAACYTRGLHAPLLLRGLPEEYRGPASWQGPSPRALLEAYVAAHPPAAAACLQLGVADVDSPGEGLAQMRGANFLAMPYSVTAGPGPLDLASQQAALAALRRLQRLDAACMAGTLPYGSLAAALGELEGA